MDEIYKLQRKKYWYIIWHNMPSLSQTSSKIIYKVGKNYWVIKFSKSGVSSKELYCLEKKLYFPLLHTTLHF